MTCEKCGATLNISEYRRHLKAHGLQEMVRHVGSPGSDKNAQRHTQRFV